MTYRAIWPNRTQMRANRNVHRLLLTIYRSWSIADLPVPSVICQLQVKEPYMTDTSRNYVVVRNDVNLTYGPVGASSATEISQEFTPV